MSNKKKLFVDDIRLCPDNTWEIARNYRQAMSLLGTNEYDEISLDHDIDSFDSYGREFTGYTILCHLEKLKLQEGKNIPFIWIHTANPAVAKKMYNVAQMLNNWEYKEHDKEERA